MCEPVSLIAAVSGVAGLVTSAFGQKQQREGISAASEASVKAENAREQQMILESERQKRETFRQFQRARAEALAGATNQGAAQGSGILGAEGALLGQASSQINATDRAVTIGQEIFQANRDYANAQRNASLGSGASSLGLSIASNAVQIGKQTTSIGSGLFTGKWNDR